MADYRLPMDDDGVKYHGVVDDDGQYPGQVLYGLDKNGRLKPANVDDEGNVLTQATGSKVKKEFFAKSMSISDKETKRSDEINIGKYRRFSIFCYSTVDVDIKLFLDYRGEDRGYIYYYDKEDENWNSSTDIKIKPNSYTIYNLTTHYDFIKHLVVENLEFRIKPLDEPSEGSISIWIEGVED